MKIASYRLLNRLTFLEIYFYKKSCRLNRTHFNKTDVTIKRFQHLIDEYCHDKSLEHEDIIYLK